MARSPRIAGSGRVSLIATVMSSTLLTESISSGIAMPTKYGQLPPA